VQTASVGVEWAPPRKFHLNDPTSFDVVARYVRADGRQAIAGIEIKLIERQSPLFAVSPPSREVSVATPASDPTLGVEVGELQRASFQEAVPVRVSTWVASTYPEVSSLSVEWPSSITRADLAGRASETRWDNEQDLRALFVLTMMWGSGTRNGRGPRNTQAALASRSAADVLRQARLCVAAGEVADAYMLHRRLPGVGPAFFTKWLWLVGQTTELRPKPLILDSLVWQSLRDLGWNSEEAARTRRWGARYVAYLMACESWATDGFSAEDVEYTLFIRAKESA
jgi:hypothetical protein